MLEGVLVSGKATWSDDQLLPMDRHGYLEETYWTYSYSPIRDESGAVVGVFTAVNETTARVIAERRLRTLQELSTQASMAKIPHTIDLAAEKGEKVGWSLAKAVKSGKTVLVDDVVTRFGAMPRGPLSVNPQQAIVLPLRTAAQDRVVGVLVMGVNPCRVLDTAHSMNLPPGTLRPPLPMPAPTRKNVGAPKPWRNLTGRRQRSSPM
jgi:hypothetical protein